MRILLKISLISFSFNCFSNCDFKLDVKKIISLSGTTTVLVKELGLLNHSKLHGISIFNPIAQNEFGGKFYPGGIFLSQNSLTELSGAVVWYDESRDLRRILALHQKIISREIITRNQTPSETIQSALSVIRPFIHGCERKITALTRKVEDIEKLLIQKFPLNHPVIFYLGEFSRGRPPEMVIVNDGVVKWLIEKKKIKTYPSKLAYVNWSAKILQSFPTGTLHIAVKDTGNKNIKEIKKSANQISLMFPGALVPGLSQLEAFLFLTEKL